MKFCGATGMSAAATSDSDLLLGACWQSAEHFLDTKILADHGLAPDKIISDNEEMSPDDHRSTADILDTLLNSGSINGNLAELKPLPPFTGYTGHLSINGISGHHYHAIAQRLPEENNNYPTQSGYGSEQNVVSSSTCGVDRDSTDDTKFSAASENDAKSFPSENSESKAFSAASADSCVDTQVDSPGVKVFNSNSDTCSTVQPKTEIYDISSIEDIAAIIGSAMADTTVSSQNEDPDQNCSRDSWMDLDAWIEGACGQNSEGKPSNQNNLSEFGLQSPQHHSEFQCKLEFNSDKMTKHHDYSNKNQELFQKNFSAGSTLQTLLTHGYMPLLQNRLQNGPPVKQEAPSSTSYGMDIISTSSPPGNVVSTTDNILLNGRYMQHHYALGLKPDGLCSPDHLLGHNYPHTTTTTPMSKSKRNRSQKKQQSLHVASSIAFQNAAELSGLLGKEKPVHRCNICNRGFLNKSNIKVHLRTHTGEKPFRCEVCAKAFRQKAHLIKHQQIHKRIGRD